MSKDDTSVFCAWRGFLHTGFTLGPWGRPPPSWLARMVVDMAHNLVVDDDVLIVIVLAQLHYERLDVGERPIRKPFTSARLLRGVRKQVTR